MQDIIPWIPFIALALVGMGFVFHVLRTPPIIRATDPRPKPERPWTLRVSPHDGTPPPDAT